MESAQPDPRLGVVLNGRYRITELLGEGGMGLVYRGERLQLARPVAIKFLHLNYAKSPKFVARFEREARAMSKLSHPYCVSVIDFGVHDEPYIVMDYVVGETLRDLLDRERLSPQRAVQITRQILAGLAHAHDKGVIHRDIKPGNVMIGEATGVGDHVRIFDFGLAKLHDSGADGDHSAATVIGTPSYMSPEQTRAELIDGRADLYATGILLFEMLTGEKPFTGQDAYEVIRKQRDEPPPALSSLAPAVSSELEQVVQRALQKEREQRYQSATEFVAALDAVPESERRASILGEAAASASVAEQRHVDSTPTDVAGSGRPQRSQRLAALLLILVGVVGAFVYVTMRPETRDSGERWRPETRLAVDGAAAREPVVVAPPSLDAAWEDSTLAGDAAMEDDASDGLAEAELAAAQRALDETAEREAAPLPATGPEVNTVGEVHRLIDQGDIDGAIFGLHSLRSKSPYNPYYPYLLGDLYFQRGWWGDGLAKYREAIALSDGYRKRASIHSNAIRALGDDATYARAFVLLLQHEVGVFALPALEAAAADSSEPKIAERARLLVSSIPRY